jgi:hypothetical protein
VKTMQWNDLDHDTQLLVMDRFGDMMLSEKNEGLQFAMAAALVELEMWSNTPIVERTEYEAEPDPFCEKGWD